MQEIVAGWLGAVFREVGGSLGWGWAGSRGVFFVRWTNVREVRKPLRVCARGSCSA
jgi:hypothetical protein